MTNPKEVLQSIKDEKIVNICRELDTRKDKDALDRAILRGGLKGIIELIETCDYQLDKKQAKAIAEYLSRWYE